MECKICGLNFKVLGIHIRASHDITLDEYYDKYINPNANKSCPICGKIVKLRSIPTGYLKHCSSRCATIDGYLQDKLPRNVKNLECWEIRICLICGDGFECYSKSNKVTCSKKKCVSKRRSEVQRKERIKNQCIWCNNRFPVSPSRSDRRFCSLICYNDWVRATGIFKGRGIGRHHSEETREKISKSFKKLWQDENYRNKMSQRMSGENNPMYDVHICGENHWNWQDGKSFEPYGIEFNKELKENVRKRDNYTCQECGMTEDELGYTLSCHHIDYDKKNNSEDNLISLCNSCHLQTNFNRDDWTRYYNHKMNGGV